MRLHEIVRWVVDDTQTTMASVVESLARLRDDPPPERFSDVLDVTLFSREPHTLRRPLHSLNRARVFHEFVDTLEQQIERAHTRTHTDV